MKKRVANILSWLFASITVGVITKYVDTLPFLGDVFTRLGIWVLIGTLIATYSKTPIRAAFHTLIFFTGMLIGYYVYSKLLFGVFSTKYFLYWGVYAIVSPFLAAIVWFAKNDRRLSFVLPALPMGLMLSLSVGMGLFYMYLNHIEELIMYFVLGLMFYKEPKQIALVIFLSIVIASIIKNTSLSWYTVF